MARLSPVWPQRAGPRPWPASNFLPHVASRTVFGNWPTGQTPVHHVSAVDFSPHSGYLAIGNERGRTLLYRLNYYDEA